ncbi:hypothetical protein NL50_10300 [Clostridium acetobutylicum]|nr:hypothetical protein NL50_10300 [Clostridium acetobutylicum]
MLYILIILGAALIVLLGVKLIVRRKDKVALTVSADISYKEVLSEAETKGTKVVDDYGRRYEILINIKVKNSGDNNFEIVSVFMEIEFENGVLYEIRIMPDDLPKMLTEGEMIETNIQKEWIDYENINSFGVMDSKGRHYYLPKEKLDKLWIKSNDLPTTKLEGYEKDNPLKVMEAFEAKDKSTFIRKN